MPDEPSEAERERIQTSVNDSVFPLQIGLKLLVQGGDERAMRWRVSLSEHAWKDPLSDDAKFLDLVIRGSAAADPMRLVVECKRTP